jgi:alkyl sulfatase BDS1-like metallo-beta-lactamase superfamily hydrolase
VQVDPVAAASRGISMEDVRTVLAKSNSNTPVGSISGMEAQQNTTLENTSGCLLGRVFRGALLAVMTFGVVAAHPAAGQEPKPAEPAVSAANHAVLSQLPFANRDDYQDAARGFIATIPEALVTGSSGNVVWSQKDYDFLDNDQTPDTINPSLWRQAQLNHRHGLFKVVDGLYQIRGFDISNMTMIEGNTGLIVIDPLLSLETAKAALDLYYQNRPHRPVVAVIYTHSHADHYGGVKGVTNEADVASGRVAIIAPEGFLERAVSESVIAGNAARRRGLYQFGTLLPKGERGQVDAGLGKTIPLGTTSLIAPTDLIRRSGEMRTIDGVEIVFEMAPQSEAPAELYMYYPRFKVLNMAEVATHNFHNLLPFRGTEVRDALAWSKYLNEALDAFGDKTEVMIAQHHWPVFGGARIRSVLNNQRDLYKYVHDQTLRLLNQGFTAPEIAELLELPASLSNEWENRNYYGTVRHNAKAIYQKYLGWYDGNPANLDPLPPVEAAKKYVAYMGGADAVIRRAREDFKNGEYRFVAEVANKMVFADPANQEARELAADAYEQLGYLSESATWRNAYLYAAYELRHGAPKVGRGPAINPNTINAIPTEMLFDLLGVQLNGSRANGKHIIINWNFTDAQQVYALTLENSALTYTAKKQVAGADVSLTLTRDALNAIVLRRVTISDAIQSGQIKVNGEAGKASELFSLFDAFNANFEIVEPKRPSN